MGRSTCDFGCVSLQLLLTLQPLHNAVLVPDPRKSQIVLLVAADLLLLLVPTSPRKVDAPPLAVSDVSRSCSTLGKGNTISLSVVYTAGAKSLG
jgi:hypothetical protein